MKTEFELRVLEINHEEIIKRLEELGAIKQFERFQRRYVYDVEPGVESKWMRLRTNGLKSTLTIKEVKDKTIDGTKELEIEVNDFDKTYEILEKLGYSPRAYQENKRIQYLLNEVEIDLDCWPMIPEYVEIEGKNEEEVRDTLRKLNLENEKVTSLDVESIYEIYGMKDMKQKSLKFEEEKK